MTLVNSGDWKGILCTCFTHVTYGLACKIDVLQYIKDEPLSFILAFLFRFMQVPATPVRASYSKKFY